MNYRIEEDAVPVAGRYGFVQRMEPNTPLLEKAAETVPNLTNV
jgi:hypothetical protein